MRYVGLTVVITGATGMVGAGVLRECVESPQVDRVILLGRSRVGADHPKVGELVVADLHDVGSYEDELAGVDACLFCAGVSAAGRSEADYRRITYDLTLGIAAGIARRSPGATFCYVSGAGTSTDSRAMWARVKGRTEDDLSALPLDAYALRPGLIQPRHGERSRTAWYRVFYALATPFYPLLRRLAPGAVTSTEQMGRAMIALALHGADTRVLETRDINAIDATLAARPAAVAYPVAGNLDVRLVKAGRMKIEYPAVVAHDDGNHLVVEATWAGEGSRDLGVVVFGPGDLFTEHYWADRSYSIKEVRDPAGVLKGWYCDVTRRPVRRPRAVYVEDLDLDLWASADLATIARLDEDEFADSGLAERDPAAAAEALAALDALEELAARRFDDILQT
jgi:hypothetical protein